MAASAGRLTGILTRREFLGVGAAGLWTALALGRSDRPEGRFQRSLAALGTRVRLVTDGVAPAVASLAAAAAFDEIRAVDRLMSTHDPGSLLSRVNRLAGHEAVVVDPRIAEVVRLGLEVGRASGGAFDMTVLPLLQAWGFRGYRFDRPPDPDELARAEANVGAEQVSLEGERLGLLQPGAGIDLGGIAKGYAVDRAVAALRGFGVERALVEAGGDLYALGRPRDEEGWAVGLRDPRGEGVLAVFRLADRAVATSGAYESFVTYGDRRFGHLMDPRAGRPAEGMPGVSVSAPNGALADAWATALFVGGDPGRIPGGLGWLRLEPAGADLVIRTGGGFPACERVG